MGYWIASVSLIAFGFLAMFSIGRPFFLVGVAMLVLGPLRSRPVLFWPPMVAVIAYNVGYWVVAPIYCTATQDAVGASTTCLSLIGMGYEGATADDWLAAAHVTGLQTARSRSSRRSWRCSGGADGSVLPPDVRPEGLASRDPSG